MGVRMRRDTRRRHPARVRRGVPPRRRRGRDGRRAGSVPGDERRPDLGLVLRESARPLPPMPHLFRESPIDHAVPPMGRRVRPRVGRTGGPDLRERGVVELLLPPPREVQVDRVAAAGLARRDPEAHRRPHRHRRRGRRRHPDRERRRLVGGQHAAGATRRTRRLPSLLHGGRCMSSAIRSPNERVPRFRPWTAGSSHVSNQLQPRHEPLHVADIAASARFFLMPPYLADFSAFTSSGDKTD